MPYARRTDRTHSEVIDALRRSGWFVFDTSRIGKGFPDAVAARAGRVRLCEIKDGAKPPSARKLTADEQKVAAAFGVAGVPIVVLTSAADALRLE